MKIKVNENENQLTYADLSVGDVFKFEGIKYLYLKINRYDCLNLETFEVKLYTTSPKDRSVIKATNAVLDITF